MLCLSVIVGAWHRPRPADDGSDHPQRTKSQGVAKRRRLPNLSVKSLEYEVVSAVWIHDRDGNRSERAIDLDHHFKVAGNTLADGIVAKIRRYLEPLFDFHLVGDRQGTHGPDHSGGVLLVREPTPIDPRAPGEWPLAHRFGCLPQVLYSTLAVGKSAHCDFGNLCHAMALLKSIKMRKSLYTSPFRRETAVLAYGMA